MQKWQTAVLSSAALLIVFGASAKAAQSRRAARTHGAKVMILGVAHLEAKNDVHNNVFEDSPLSPKRQEQVADIIRRLSRFHPTKVLIEAPMGDPKYGAHYQQFLAGRYVLPANEIYQFGFHLASHAKNSTIYPVDTPGPPTPDEDSASEKRQEEFLKAHLKSVSTPAFKAMLARSSTLQQNGTYLDLLRYLNTDTAIRANASWYSVLNGMGRDADNAGSAYVARWYTRNCCIFSNILSIIQPGDRVIVIIGQGHEYILREFTRLNPSLVDVDPLYYLK